jgi:hypothetical protein
MPRLIGYENVHQSLAVVTQDSVHRCRFAEAKATIDHLDGVSTIALVCLITAHLINPFRLSRPTDKCVRC